LYVAEDNVKQGPQLGACVVTMDDNVHIRTQLHWNKRKMECDGTWSQALSLQNEKTTLEIAVLHISCYSREHFNPSYAGFYFENLLVSMVGYKICFWKATSS